MYFLGAVTGASGAYNNQATGQSGIGTFTIPATAKALYLMPSASGVFFELGPSGFQTTAARAAQLDGPNLVNGPFRAVQNCTTVSIFNPAGGFVSVRVYAAPSS